ncbi:hypothetical protein EVAR_62608_1 [Eumeta japonica]|uniref:Uncharacterized protein n=1 Tax=Eumeta variegata TaxID=151549 RepID=A0A4C1ZA03_EUMVA|nr:hypothetical protein EVAR_62608_1 [Eumeta japonica]
MRSVKANIKDLKLKSAARQIRRRFYNSKKPTLQQTPRSPTPAFRDGNAKCLWLTLKKRARQISQSSRRQTAATSGTQRDIPTNMIPVYEPKKRKKKGRVPQMRSEPAQLIYIIQNNVSIKGSHSSSKPARYKFFPEQFLLRSRCHVPCRCFIQTPC